MCGRFTIRKPVTKTVDIVKTNIKVEDSDNYNAHPTQQLPIIKSYTNGKALELCEWGLVPAWSKKLDKFSPLINARKETLMEKVTFKNLIQTSRCIVPADGYYEWENSGPSKTPYYIHFSDTRSMAFAGLWDRWNDNGSGSVSSYSIITKQASQSIRFIHERMPVILPAHYWKDWLDPDLSADLMNDMIHSSISELSFHPVSTLVNNPDNDTESLITPVQPKTNDTQDEFKF